MSCNRTSAAAFKRQQSKTFALRGVCSIALAATASAFLTLSAHAETIAPKVQPQKVQATACSEPGTIWWSELLAPETEKVGEFYAKVIGWNTKIVDVSEQRAPAASPNDRYTIFTSQNKEIAGLMKAKHPDAAQARTGWFTYIEVADVDQSISAVEENGGTILQQPVDFPDGNRIAVVQDPMGHTFGLVTPPKKPNC